MRVLVVHGLVPDSRQTTIEHVGCFQEHLAGVEAVFHHLNQPVERLVGLAPFDLIILNYCFLGHRQAPRFEELERRYRVLKDLGPLAAIPQDDYCHHRILDDWLADWGVAHVWTPVFDHREFLYPRTSRAATFYPALTGYVASTGSDALTRRLRPLARRRIDLGTRVRFLSPHLGRQGQAKGRLAEAVRAALVHTDLVVDISTRIEDTFVGGQWLEFLANCRFVLGQQGGASLADPDGSLRRRVEEYQARHPDANFDEVEAACFPGLDGRRVMSAISPRLFEAAALGACQILIPDDYLGLEPWTHYIPIEPDLANLDEVTAAMRDLDRAQEITDACFDALIRSRRFTYREFARHVVETATGTVLPPDGARIRVFADSAELRLVDAPRQLGPDLFCALRRWLMASLADGPAALLAVQETLEAAAGPNWVEGLSSHDGAHQLPATATIRFDAGLICRLVDEIRHVRGVEACLDWVHALLGGRIGMEQLLPWSEVPTKIGGDIRFANARPGNGPGRPRDSVG